MGGAGDRIRESMGRMRVKKGFRRQNEGVIRKELFRGNSGLGEQEGCYEWRKERFRRSGHWFQRWREGGRERKRRIL